MVRTKKEQVHNAETCVCSDCKTRKLELEVIDLRARYADERAHYEAQLEQAKKALKDVIARVEARQNADRVLMRDGLNKRLASLENAARADEGRSTIRRSFADRLDALEGANIGEVHHDILGRIKNLEESNGYSDIVRRLRTLEANRPVDIRDSDASAIQRDLKVVSAKLGRIADRLDPPNGLPF